jgi:predicted AAA+ superfamily ATPase
MYHSRELAESIVHALRSLPVVVVTGMRQTGKTTLLQQDSAFRNRRYVTLDDLEQLEAARRDPDEFTAGDDPLTIDAIQKCPELLSSIKRRVDKDRRHGKYLLSGSANLSLLESVSESLAGRALYTTLEPFSARELKGKISGAPFLKRFLELELPKGSSPKVEESDVLAGGMPSVCLGEVEDPLLWFKGFEQTYLERDLRDLAQVADLPAFRRLLRLAALRTGQVLNQSELGRDAKLNAVTTGRYLNLMETSFVIERLPAYLGNRASRLIKAPKLYFADSGLAAYLTGVRDIAPPAVESLRGALIETYVAQNLRSLLGAHWPEARLHYWHIQGGYEVDFVIEYGRKCIAIEVKSAGQWRAPDLHGLEAFLRFTPHCQAAILAHRGTNAVKVSERLWALPLGLVLS